MAMYQLEKKPKLKRSATLVRRGAELEKTHVYNIKFSNLGLTLNNGAEILKGVSGELRPGRFLAIMGPSGSGKSTFMNVLSGKVRRTDGIISINDKPGELRSLRRLVGFVPQDDISSYLFSWFIYIFVSN
jgi:ABC-type multidrug transport system ATPase subunit